jgi:hypothetical protein
VEKHVGDISGTDAMEVRMKDEHVIAWLAIGSPSDNQRPTPEHQPIYNNTIYPWYRTTYSWADLMEFPLQYKPYYKACLIKVIYIIITNTVLSLSVSN